MKIALSGNFQPSELIRLIIGLWIPWAMLFFYDTNIPPTAFTFPGAVVGGGNWLMDFFIADIPTAMKTELSELINNHLTVFSNAWAKTSLWELMGNVSAALNTLVMGSVMLAFVILGLIVLYCVTYAQVIWAQVAIAILLFLGPIFIPWLVFEPMAFLFWGWFRALIVFSLYGAIAGAVMRVFLGVGLGFITTLSNTQLNLESPVDMAGWVLIILPLVVSGVLASLKVGELASMLVGGGGGGSGLTSIALMAATGGKSALAGAAGKK